MSKNNDKSIISTLFTEKELKELDFTAEELELLEAAEETSQMIDLLPSTEKEIEEFFAKFDAEFAPNDDMAATMQKFLELPQHDPKFFNQILAMNLLIDEVEEVPEAKQEKVSLDDIAKEKTSQAVKARKAKFAAIDEALKNKK